MSTSSSSSASSGATAVASNLDSTKTMTTKTTTTTCPRPIVFCGPSGVGKGTLIGMLSKRFDNDAFGFSVSHTTRSPRDGEIDGVHYHFTTIESMEAGIAKQQFLEHANVHGRYYGTSIQAVETVQSAGKICILDIDVQGVQNVKKSSLAPYYIFVAPPSMTSLESRLRGRGTEQEEDIQRRLANAEAELNYGKQTENFDLVLINDDLTKTFELLVKNIQKWYPHLKQIFKPRPVVFAGPSGVGKGTLIKMLMERFTDQQLGFSVSHTTRKPREGEVDGVHYHFTTVEKIRSEIAEGKFLEYAEVHGNYYGTSIAAVEQVQSQGRVCILDIDIQGVQNVKKSALKAYYVFLAPPSMEELEKRLRGRGTEEEASIQKRLKNASEELDYGQRSGNFDRVFINADLNATLQDLVETFQLWYPQLNEIAPDDPPPKNCTCILS